MVDDGNWSVGSIVSFWNVISLSVGSINFIAENMFLWAFKTFKFVLPLEGLNWRVTGVLIRLFTITAAVAISIVLCIIVLFALGGNSGFFNVMISISEHFSLFLSSFTELVFSSDGGLLLEVSKVVVFFFTVIRFRCHRRKLRWERGVER